jgi:hypothetical protein
LYEREIAKERLKPDLKSIPDNVNSTNKADDWTKPAPFYLAILMPNGAKLRAMKASQQFDSKR